MQVDAITLAALADEWRAQLEGARIDTIIQPTEHAIALQCYAPGAREHGGHNLWLMLSTHPQFARAHITRQKPTKIAAEPPPFVMLLRKHLEGARIESIVQPRWERIIEIIAGYRKSQESEERVRFRLIVEIMGRLSNIILCDEHDIILGSLKHVGADINRYRVIAPREAYIPPPPQQRNVAGQTLPRLEPSDVTASQLQLAAFEVPVEPSVETKKGRSRKSEPRLWEVLTRNLLGFGPMLSRESVFRTVGDTEALPVLEESGWEELAWNVRDLAALYNNHTWKPQLVERVQERPGEAPAPVAFAPYVLEQYLEAPGMRVRPCASMNDALDEYFAGAEWRDALDSVRAPVRKVLHTQLERCKRKAEALRHEMEATAEASAYRQQAELLLAYQHEVRQGQTSVTLSNFFEGEEDAPQVSVPLDPRFDAVGNANRLFNRYHKLRRALALVPPQIEQNEAELATIEQLLTDLALAETPAEVALVKAEVQAAGYLRGAKTLAPKHPQKSKGKGGKQAKGKPVPPGGGVPLHAQSRDGFTILAGKNSRQNEDVTFHHAVGNDLWLHARGVPGAHVIVKSGGRDIPRSTIDQAASLAAYYSQARGSTSVPVDYTLQKYVRHMKGGGPGMVIYEREKTIYAEPRAMG